jgi:hypothetical protein
LGLKWKYIFPILRGESALRPFLLAIRKCKTIQ